MSFPSHPSRPQARSVRITCRISSTGLEFPAASPMTNSKTNGSTTGTLVFDLGAVFSLADAQVWNYNADCCGLERGVQTMTVLTSLDDVTFTPLNTFGLSEGTGLPLAPNVLDLAGASARYVEFDLTQNYGDAGFIGLSEVQFDSSAIPEPSAAFFLIGGLSVLASVRHRAARP